MSIESRTIEQLLGAFESHVKHLPMFVWPFDIAPVELRGLHHDIGMAPRLPFVIAAIAPGQEEEFGALIRVGTNGKIHRIGADGRVTSTILSGIAVTFEIPAWAGWTIVVGYE